jgi:hypothetical protein
VITGPTAQGNTQSVGGAGVHGSGTRYAADAVGSKKLSRQGWFSYKEEWLMALIVIPKLSAEWPMRATLVTRSGFANSVGLES